MLERCGAPRSVMRVVRCNKNGTSLRVVLQRTARTSQTRCAETTKAMLLPNVSNHTRPSTMLVLQCCALLWYRGRQAQRRPANDRPARLPDLSHRVQCGQRGR